MDFITSQQSKFPDLSDKYETLGRLFENKLWHQLSIALHDFISDRTNHRGSNILELYEGFIANFETRLDQVRLVSLLSSIGNTLNNDANALAFFQKSLQDRKRLGEEASLCLDMDVVITKIKLGMLDEVKDKLEEAKNLLGTLKSTESIAFSKVYLATLEYRKLVGPPQEFYSAALMYLSYTSMDSISTEAKYILATDILLAAITGDDIYNFGEVVATPLLSVLQGTPNSWLFELVHSLNNGDVNQFNEVVDTFKAQYSSQPSLVGRHEIVKQKVVLLSLINMTFERASHDRQISFVDIAKRTMIPVDQVEWVLMRAMSVGLLKGTIDEVDSNVDITWIHPRVLEKRQLKLLSEQLAGWTERVKNALVTVEDHASALYM